MSKLVRYSVLVVSALGIVTVCNFLFNVVGPGDSLGVASANCARQDFSPVPNGAGMVATAHAVNCTYGLAHGADTTFMYVHKPEEADGRKSLVFRFSNFGTLGDPQMTWSDSSSLNISIPEVGEITKQLGSMGATRIAYSIGKVDVSPQEHLRLIRLYAAILVAFLVLLITVLSLTLRSLRKPTYRMA